MGGRIPQLSRFGLSDGPSEKGTKTEGSEIFRALSPAFLRARGTSERGALRTDLKVNLGTIKRLRGRGGFTVLLPYNTCAGLIFPKKEAAAL